MAVPRISLNTKLQDSAYVPDEELVEIGLDQFGPGFGGKGTQWTLAVRPLSGRIQGRTGMDHEFYNNVPEDGKIRANSKLGVTLQSLVDVFGEVMPELEIGQGQLVGLKVFTKHERGVKFGEKKNDDGTVTEYRGDLFRFTRLPTAEELAEFGEAPQEFAGSFEWTSEATTTVVELLDGVKRKSLASVAIKNKDRLGDPQLVKMVASGEAADYLVEQGILTEADGAYARA